MSSDREESAVTDARRNQHALGTEQTSSEDAPTLYDGNNDSTRHHGSAEDAIVQPRSNSTSNPYDTSHMACPSHSTPSDLEACTCSQSPERCSTAGSASTHSKSHRPQSSNAPSGISRITAVRRSRPRSRSLFPSGASYSSNLTHHDTFAYRVEDEREMERDEEQEDIHEKRFRKRDQWRSISNFHFGWYGVTMSTGMAGQLLHNLPYQFHGLNILVIIVFIFTLIQFVLFTVVSIVRYILWPRKFLETFQSPTQSLTLSMVPMALVTIINMTIYVCAPHWGDWVLMLAWVLWWIDAAMSLFVCFFISYLLFTVQEFQLQTMTASWLLPAISVVVATSCGSIVANAMTNNNQQLITVFVCYIMWGISVPFSTMVLTMYYQRLIIHKVVPEVSIASSMAPVGPMGQGGFGIMQLGVVARTLLPRNHVLDPFGGEVFYACGVLIALGMWGLGLLWLCFALATFICASSRIRFNLGWWAVVFPSGVFALATVQLWKETGFLTFKVLAMIESVTVILTWLWVSGLTLWKIWTGEVFNL